MTIEVISIVATSIRFNLSDNLRIISLPLISPRQGEGKRNLRKAHEFRLNWVAERAKERRAGGMRPCPI